MGNTGLCEGGSETALRLWVAGRGGTGTGPPADEMRGARSGLGRQEAQANRARRRAGGGSGGGAWQARGGGRVREWGRGLDCRLPAAQADCGAQDETRSVVCSRLHHQSLRLGVETADPQFPALQLSLRRGKAFGTSFFFSSQKQNFGMGKQQERGNPSTPFRTFLGRVLLECIMEREPQEARREVPHSCTLGTLSEALTKLAYRRQSDVCKSKKCELFFRYM